MTAFERFILSAIRGSLLILVLLCVMWVMAQAMTYFFGELLIRVMYG